VSKARAINVDVPCVECGYNLRGLSADGHCPECGAEVADAIEVAKTVDVDVEAAAATDAAKARRRMYERVATLISYPVDAIAFVHAALSLAGPGCRPGEGGRLISARDVCNAVRKYAMWYFNDKDEALDLLTAWKVRSSEDVGRIIYGMVAAGMLKTSPDDSASDFDGLFVLKRLFEDDTRL